MAGITAFRATYGKKAENLHYGLERCVPFLYILGENFTAYHNVFTVILRNFCLSNCHF